MVWAEEPFTLLETPCHKGLDPKLPSVAVADSMCQVHNALFRGLNVIYNQAQEVEKRGSAQDIEDFVAYTSLMVEMIHHHHGVEEKYFFPEFEKIHEGVMSVNIEQHKPIHEAVDKLLEYVESAQKDKSFQSQKLLQLLDELKEPLHAHMSAEIDTLLDLPKHFDQATIHEITENTHKQAMKGVDPKTSLPLILSLCDRDFEGGPLGPRFPPPVPWFFSLLVKYWWAPKRSNLWRFSPCDLNHKRQPLLFGPTNRR
jgi:hemerythrin-like domain-containing protein